MSLQIHFYFVKNEQIYHGYQSVYQKTLEKGKVKYLPRNFVYLIHNDEPKILIANRDNLEPEVKDAQGNIISNTWSELYYKKANLSKATLAKIQEKKYEDGELLLPVCVNVDGSNYSYKIKPGHIFNFNVAKAKYDVTPFDPTDKEIYYDDQNARSKQWHELVDQGVPLK